MNKAAMKQGKYVKAVKVDCAKDIHDAATWAKDAYDKVTAKGTPDRVDFLDSIRIAQFYLERAADRVRRTLPTH